MGWTDRFRRKPAMESRAEWGSSAIPLPNEGNANTYANVDLRRADTSMQKVAVWAAVVLLSRIVGSLPLDTFRRRGDGPPANIGNSRFLDDPAGDGQGLPDWLAQYMTSMLLRGNVYGKQILGPDAYPNQIVLYHPDTVDGWRDLYTGQVHWYVEGKDLGASGVWHRRAYPMPGNLLGMSPIGLHMTTIGQGMAAARFGYQFFADGAMPSGMLRNTEVAIDKKVADVAKARWMATMHGSREVAVMGKGWEYQAIQVAPEESQFLETQKYTAAECARMYGPGVPEILGYETGGSMTYANVDQRSLHLLIYALDPWLTGLERMFTAMLPQPQFVKFNRAALLRMTTAQRYDAYQTASEIGLQTPNEQRAMEDWAPVAWGDKPWVAAQQAPPPPGQEAAGARPLVEVRTEDPWDEESAALLVAIAQLHDEEGWAQRAWDAGKHPRIPKGEPGAGRFLSLVEQFKTAIKKHAETGGGHPLKGFNREQLRRVAKARGIDLKRGESWDSIAEKLLNHIGGPAPARKGKSVDGLDLSNPDLGNDPVSREILEGMIEHGDSADDHVDMLVEDGMDRDIARLYVNEIVDLHNSRHPESPLQHASKTEPAPARKAKAEPEDRIRAGIASGVKTQETLSGGIIGEVHLVTFNDGSSAVRKVAGKHWGTRSPKELTDNEHFASLVARAVGADVPAVVRTGPHEVYMDFVDHAKTAAEVDASGDFDTFDKAIESDAGLRLGLLDQLIFNGDRNNGNWLIRNGQPVGIDHGLAWPTGVERFAEVPHPMGIFGARLSSPSAGFEETTLTPADYDRVIDRLENLRPAFDEAGRGDQLDASIRRAHKLAEYATGTVDRIRPS